MTEEERTAAKAERKRLLENNKIMAAAESVRRDWIRTTLLKSSTLPKGADKFLMSALLHGNTTEGRTQGLAAALLGFKVENSWQTASKIAEARRRAEIVTLALAIATHERYFQKDVWRYPNPNTREYFKTLIAWGYEACEVEKEIATGK